jgi:hypothetical protein
LSLTLWLDSDWGHISASRRAVPTDRKYEDSERETGRGYFLSFFLLWGFVLFLQLDHLTFDSRWHWASTITHRDLCGMLLCDNTKEMVHWTQQPIPSKIKTKKLKTKPLIFFSLLCVYIRQLPSTSSFFTQKKPRCPPYSGCRYYITSELVDSLFFFFPVF